MCGIFSRGEQTKKKRQRQNDAWVFCCNLLKLKKYKITCILYFKINHEFCTYLKNYNGFETEKQCYSVSTRHHQKQQDTVTNCP